MDILIDGRSLTNNTSGIGRYTIELTKGYIKHYGHSKVTVILHEKIENFPYKYIICNCNRHSILGTIKFTFFLIKLKYNIYHAGDTIGPFWHNKKSKYICTVHDLMFLTVPNFYGEKSFKNYLRIKKNIFLTHFVLLSCDQIISVSAKTSSDLKEMLKFNSIVLREGVNQINNISEALSERVTKFKKNSYFFYVGLAYPHKNIDFMIDSFAKSNTDKKLIICGKNHKIRKVQNVEYLGFVSDAELSYLYTNCSAFIFPSLYEGFGLPILEALSFGSKVFSSNAGSLSEFSPELINYFNPNKENELITLLEQVDDIKLDHCKVKEYLEKFNWNTIWFEYHKNTNHKC
jgi:glycosyltransferase involved in cell wall biosynthesis